MAGAQPLEQLLGAAEGAPHRQALGDEGGQRGQDAQRGELRGAREMQGAQGRAVVVETCLGDLHQGVEMRRGLVGEFVPDGGGDDAARRTEEQGAAQLPLQGAYLAGDGGLGEAEQPGGAGEGPGAVNRDKSA
ncbi:hypothetical protein SANTM175S_07653 [Streptomyces antimycoticus]